MRYFTKFSLMLFMFLFFDQPLKCLKQEHIQVKDSRTTSNIYSFFFANSFDSMKQRVEYRFTFHITNKLNILLPCNKRNVM